MGSHQSTLVTTRLVDLYRKIVKRWKLKVEQFGGTSLVFTACTVNFVPPRGTYRSERPGNKHRACNPRVTQTVHTFSTCPRKPLRWSKKVLILSMNGHVPCSKGDQMKPCKEYIIEGDSESSYVNAWHIINRKFSNYSKTTGTRACEFPNKHTTMSWLPTSHNGTSS